MRNTDIEYVKCPLCEGNEHTDFAEENGFKAVKCLSCGFIYVNPRPKQSVISKAIETGFHNEVEGGRNVVVRRLGSNVGLYKHILKQMFVDVWEKGKAISWLDIGAGYGEFIEAVTAVAPVGSNILGIEPMCPKAIVAQNRGLAVKNIFLKDVEGKYDIVSLINVFSHIPDIRFFLKEIKEVLKPRGELLLETGNIADLKSVKEVPTELDIPDHLIFAGEKNIQKLLMDARFEILDIKRRRKDTAINLLKNIIKKFFWRRKVTLALPYTSAYRSLIIRARLMS